MAECHHPLIRKDEDKKYHNQPVNIISIKLCFVFVNIQVLDVDQIIRWVLNAKQQARFLHKISNLILKKIIMSKISNYVISHLSLNLICNRAKMIPWIILIAVAREMSWRCSEWRSNRPRISQLSLLQTRLTSSSYLSFKHQSRHRLLIDFSRSSQLWSSMISESTTIRPQLKKMKSLSNTIFLIMTSKSNSDSKEIISFIWGNKSKK